MEIELSVAVCFTTTSMDGSVVVVFDGDLLLADFFFFFLLDEGFRAGSMLFVDCKRVDIRRIGMIIRNRSNK